MKWTYLIVAVFFSTITLAQDMNNSALEDILAREGDSIIGVSGRWQVKYKELTMYVITDETNDRMRIITPVTEVAELDREILLVTLSANYHSVLDAKYAISDDILWSVYIHPLSPLTDEQVTSALSQVYYAAVTYGTSFSSTQLIFGGSNTEGSSPVKEKG